jgi:hypothetical protein
MKKTRFPKKLTLCTNTLRVLTDKELRDIVGGTATDTAPTEECTPGSRRCSADTLC